MPSDAALPLFLEMEKILQPFKLSRRSFMAGMTKASLLPLTAGLPPSLFSSVESKPVIVRTPVGSLEGISSQGVQCFRGIPYAHPPIGELRFMPPVALEPWKGIRAATGLAPAAMQKETPGLTLDEDCLTLNIWAPSTSGPHPVLFWIHGGGFLGGHSIDPICEGTGFAEEGVVVVTLEYRLGVFGFLDFGPLLGSSYAGTANNGLRDVLLALRWVHRNIECFGGDPNRVTIGGQSAGAKLVGLLMATEEAQPLFQSAISESGGADRASSPEASQRVSHGFASFWTAQTGTSPEQIRTASAKLLIAIQSKFIDQWPAHFPFRPQVDGILLPTRPLAGIAQNSTGKRLLIGTCREESAFFLGPVPARDPQAADLGNMTTSQFGEIFKKYKSIYPEMSVQMLRIRAVSAEEYWIPSVRVAEAYIEANAPVWMYRFDWSQRSGRFQGEAPHAAELRFVWNHPAQQGDDHALEGILAQQIHGAWLAFVRGKSPEAIGLPTWERYSLKDRATMVFNSRSLMEAFPQDDERRLWDGLLTGAIDK